MAAAKKEGRLRGACERGGTSRIIIFRDHLVLMLIFMQPLNALLRLNLGAPLSPILILVIIPIEIQQIGVLALAGPNFRLYNEVHGCEYEII